jgi:hypothetical protein
MKMESRKKRCDMSRLKIKRKRPSKASARSEKYSHGKIATAENIKLLSTNPNFIAAVNEVSREMESDEATTITITLGPGMYERIQRHLIETFAECESVETFITDALDETLCRFMNDPLTEGFSYDG